MVFFHLCLFIYFEYSYDPLVLYIGIISMCYLSFKSICTLQHRGCKNQHEIFFVYSVEL